jgi:hypothetical protein
LLARKQQQASHWQAHENKDEGIMAIRFSDTERFETPVSFRKLKVSASRAIQSPRPVAEEVLAKFTPWAIERPKIEICQNQKRASTPSAKTRGKNLRRLKNSGASPIRPMSEKGDMVLV